MGGGGWGVGGNMRVSMILERGRNIIRPRPFVRVQCSMLVLFSLYIINFVSRIQLLKPR